MAEFPVLPFYADAFLADTMHLDAMETGAYMMLLICAWRSPDCALPDDDKKLARMARCTPRQWGKVKENVLEFWSLENRFWFQKRLLKERDYLHNKRQQQSQAGKASALKRKETGSTGDALALQQAGQQSRQRAGNKDANETETPISISNRKKEEGKPSSKERGASKEREGKERGGADGPKNNKRGTRLPDGWWPDDGDMAYALEIGYSRDAVRQIVEDFCLHWPAQPGGRGVKLDWSLTFKTWCRSDLTRAKYLNRQPQDGFRSGSQHGPQHGQQKTVMQQSIDALRQAGAARAQPPEDPGMGGFGQ